MRAEPKRVRLFKDQKSPSSGLYHQAACSATATLTTINAITAAGVCLNENFVFVVRECPEIPLWLSSHATSSVN